MQVLVDDNRIVGITDGNSPIAERAPDGFTRVNQGEWQKIDGQWVRDLAGVIRDKQTQIKSEVAERIAGTAWRIERAQERDQIGAEGETESEVLAEREAIRRAGNRAETEIAELTAQAEIESYQLTVLPSDYPVVVSLSVLEFLRLFTDAERSAVRAARESGQSQNLLDFWELLQASGRVRLDNPDVVAGVGLLEQSGLIAAGRADQILAI